MPGWIVASSRASAAYPVPPAAPAPGRVASSRPIVPATTRAQVARACSRVATSAGVGALLRAEDGGRAGRAEQRIVHVGGHDDLGRAQGGAQRGQVDAGQPGQARHRRARGRRPSASRSRAPSAWAMPAPPSVDALPPRPSTISVAPRVDGVLDHQRRGRRSTRRAGRAGRPAAGRGRPPRPARPRPGPRRARTRPGPARRSGRPRRRRSSVKPARSAASTVPSPPSATGSTTVSRPGRASSSPSCRASATPAAVRQPLNLSGARTTCISRAC